jgi:hypothetical protein
MLKSYAWILLYTVQCIHVWCRESHRRPHTKSHKSRTMNERGHTGPIPWMNGVTPGYTAAAYHEWTRHINSVPWMNIVYWLLKSLALSLTRGFSGPMVFISGMRQVLMWFGKVTLRSTKISIKWLWPVKVTLKVIQRRWMGFCWSCDEGHLNINKNLPSLQFTSTDKMSLHSTIPPK